MRWWHFGKRRAKELCFWSTTGEQRNGEELNLKMCFCPSGDVINRKWVHHFFAWWNKCFRKTWTDSWKKTISALMQCEGLENEREWETSRLGKIPAEVSTAGRMEQPPGCCCCCRDDAAAVGMMMMLLSGWCWCCCQHAAGPAAQLFPLEIEVISCQVHERHTPSSVLRQNSSSCWCFLYSDLKCAFQIQGGLA